MMSANATTGALAGAPIPPDLRARLIGWYGETVVAFVESAGVTVRVLEPGQRYAEVSPLLVSIGANVDAWPIPPAGLFIIKERSVILRDTSNMTLAHEFAHAFDLALGGEQYLSTTDAQIMEAYEGASAFVTPYAASARDEFFAESVRAFVGANNTGSLWPEATRERLARTNPRMVQIIENLFAKASGGVA